METREICERRSLTAASRRLGRPDIWRTVKLDEVDSYLSEGWVVRRRNKRTISITKPREALDAALARLWTLLFRMQFPLLSDERGVSMKHGDQEHMLEAQIPIAAADPDMAVIAAAARKPDIGSAANALKATKRSFSLYLERQAPSGKKRKIATVIVTPDEVDDEDLEMFDEDLQGALVFSLRDLEYFEALCKHVGRASRYQLGAELFRNQRIPGLEIKVPALRSRVGKTTSYCFSIRPTYLLKVSYIAHRTKGAAIDVDSYQRMIKKSRLLSIRRYISNGGSFPTNIVINLEKKKFSRFEKAASVGYPDEGGEFGMLSLTPEYGAAWIIDGQHRLYAYAEHEYRNTSYLNVVAFDGLTASEQAQLFVDINSEQKSVKRSLLVELDATLKWNSPDEDRRVHAIASKVAMALDQRENPFRDRILFADMSRSEKRCITITSIVTALRKPGFFIGARRKGYTIYGPLWRTDASESLRRTIRVLEAWFGEIVAQADDWWELGQGAGGGLAMNDGVTACINVLRSVLEHLGEPTEIGPWSDDKLRQELRPWARSLGEYLGTLSLESRLRFRQHRGIEGQTMRTRLCQDALAASRPEFQPDGLDEWRVKRSANLNETGRELIVKIESVLKPFVLETLKDEFGEDRDGWWFEGVPRNVRDKIFKRMNEAGGGREEDGFDFIDYQSVASENWLMFKETLAEGPKKNVSKRDGLAWVAKVNEMRKVVMHPSKSQFLGQDQIDFLQSRLEWLTRRIDERAGLS